MFSLKLSALVCLLATIECADIGYEAACAQTDTCTVANTACFDRNEDHGTTCACTAGYKPNSTPDGCDAATALDSTCSADADCVLGASCVDVDGANSGTTKKCACSAGSHKEGTACVKNPGMSCTEYGLSCTGNAACQALNGITALPMSCRCSSGYFADGVYCAAGGNFVTASTLIIFVTLVVSRLFF